MNPPRTEAQDEVASAPSGSLPKGLALLELLSSDDAPLGITTLARHMDMPKSGVHRLLQVMRGLDWVRQTPTGEYECTLKIWELGQRVANRIDLRGAATAAMRELAEQTRETVLLSILDGVEVLYIDVIDSPQPVRAHTRPGDRAPAFYMATGKAMLAYAPIDIIDRIVGSLEKLTPQTLTMREAVEHEFERVRRKGYAINRGEWSGGAHGVAAPIFNSRGEAVAAISVGAPGERMPEAMMRNLAPIVMQAAKRVSRELGHTG
ncbi:IclR family transcriptional regulator [Paraburkholderia susongensis]|uniref:Transcriptional regulator, IclR family n=1 Tax=Paraburkholderia susongensis TaxID=1515439 RepID=A0A1X7LGI0_9BURK|nr:IclR family transcriptional regulator [Paraburkholderia susongensis]SMG52968.1 transcriptional regulator, IclR family [Paraburkholderia susongensis]